METAPWDALAAPFAASELTWRVVRVSADKLSAQVRPQLPAAVVTSRLDAVLGVGGWSHSFVGMGERGLCCTLTVRSAPGTVSDVHKSAAVAYTEYTGVEAAAEDALAAAAAFFGLRSPVALDELPWVDFDAEQGQILYEPDAATDTAVDLPDDTPTDAPEVTPAAERAPSAAPPPASVSPTKSAGQQAIDKLLDRLKSEGRGLQAAKLLNTYGGYGSDPQAARELYARLRELLMERPDA